MESGVGRGTDRSKTGKGDPGLEQKEEIQRHGKMDWKDRSKIWKVEPEGNRQK